MSWKWLLMASTLVAGCSASSSPVSSGATDADGVATAPVASSDDTVDVAGAAIRFQSSGESQAAPLTFLFLHGAAFTSDTWVENGILDASSQGAVQSIAVDLPGYGESERVDLDEAAFIPALLVALDLAPAATLIISPSMSGIYSLSALAAGNIDDLAGFVGVAPSGSSGFAGSLAEPLPVPALAVWGDGDGSDPLGQAQALASGFVNGEPVVIADAGHAAYNQQPEVFTTLLRDFAATLEACADTCLDD